jgi:hypothetical protein
MPGNCEDGSPQTVSKINIKTADRAIEPGGRAQGAIEGIEHKHLNMFYNIEVYDYRQNF